MEEEKIIDQIRSKYFLKEIGIRIVKIRHAQDMTQEELAYRVKCTPKTLSDIENGKSDLRVSTLFRIATALNLSLADFFTYPIK
ncbi:MAG: helix-turn-helix domain-containing protein [Anaeroplasma sp.]